MAWTKLLTPAWLDIPSAAKQLKTSRRDVENRIANGEFIIQNPTPNVTEIRFHKTDGTPKYILAIPGVANPTPTARPARKNHDAVKVDRRAYRVRYPISRKRVTS